jgi:hypothetical protein
MDVRMMKTTIVLFLACGLCSAFAGLSKLDALAMIETGNNDAAIGRAGEVSRYQIKPRVWREYTPSRSWHDASVSRQVAQQYLADLELLFRTQTGRAPSDFDLYVLWNAGPTYYSNRDYSAQRVGPTVRERALRYVNLRRMPDPSPSQPTAPRPQPVVHLTAPLPPLPPTSPGLPLLANSLTP